MIRPLGDRVVVKPIEVPISTLIEVEGRPGETVMFGEVLAVGPGARKKNGRMVSVPIEVGDRVSYSKRGNASFEVDGLRVTMLQTKSIVGIVDGHCQ
jgi:chaperonin GroES